MEDKTRQRTLFDALVREVEEIAASRPDDAEFNHLAGLCWYQHPETSDERSRLARSYLERAVQLNPDHQFARLFLAHHHFDEKRYLESLDCLLAVDYDYFTNRDQSWRNLKADELKLTCELYLSSGDTPLADAKRLADQVERLADRYSDAAPENCAVPTEIVWCVVDLIKGRPRSDSLVRITKTIMRLVENLEYVIPLQTEYNSLARYAATA